MIRIDGEADNDSPYTERSTVQLIRNPLSHHQHRNHRLDQTVEDDDRTSDISEISTGELLNRADISTDELLNWELPSNG